MICFRFLQIGLMVAKNAKKYYQIEITEEIKIISTEEIQEQWFKFTNQLPLKLHILKTLDINNIPKLLKIYVYEDITINNKIPGYNCAVPFFLVIN